MTKPFTKDSFWATNKNALELLPPNQVALFACDVARLSLPIWEQYHPKDKRPRTAIETTERYVYGKTTAEQLENASELAWAALTDLAKSYTVANAAVDSAYTAAKAATYTADVAIAAIAARDAVKAVSATAAAYATARDAVHVENLYKVIQSIFLQTTTTPIPVTPVLQSIAENIVTTRNFEEYYVLLDNLEEFHNIQLPREIPIGLSHNVLFRLTNTN